MHTSDAAPLFIAVGGLVGSGRTTVLLRLAAAAVARGRRVWIVSPDVGPQLDAATLCAASGVEPGAGAAVTAWVTGPAPASYFAAFDPVAPPQRPDLILSEPQAHCIDRVLDTTAALAELFGGALRIGPYVAVIDPARAWAALGDPAAAHSQKARFLYRTRQNEAELLALNRIDLLPGGQCADVARVVAEHFPRGRVLPVSAMTGAGFEALIEATLGRGERT